MGKHKSKLIAAVVILVVLAGAWFWGGGFLNTEAGDLPASAHMAQDAEASAQTGGGGTAFVPDQVISGSGGGQGGTTPPAGETGPGVPPTSPSEPAPGSPPVDPPSDAPSVPAPQPPAEPPSGQPPALPPEDPQAPGDGSFTVTLTVRADTILRNMHLLDSAKHSLVPSDGVIFPATQVTAREGESVFDVLQREMRRVGIHMVSRFTPIYNSAYIEAINNIFEFDVGPLSGWMHRVNGQFPGVGVSQTLLRPGDVIEVLYTVDLGHDIGGGFS